MWIVSQDADNDERWEQWIAAVDAEFIKLIGIGRDDLPDQDYWELFQGVYTPKQAVEIIMEELAEQHGMGL